MFCLENALENLDKKKYFEDKDSKFRFKVQGDMILIFNALRIVDSNELRIHILEPFSNVYRHLKKSGLTRSFLLSSLRASCKEIPRRVDDFLGIEISNQDEINLLTVKITNLAQALLKTPYDKAVDSLFEDLHSKKDEITPAVLFWKKITPKFLEINSNTDEAEAIISLIKGYVDVMITQSLTCSETLEAAVSILFEEFLKLLEYRDLQNLENLRLVQFTRKIVGVKSDRTFIQSF